MSNYSYHIDIPIISLIILLSVLWHIASHGLLEDQSSKLYRKLVLLSLLDILFDLISILVPLIPNFNEPAVYNLLNGIYFQLNVFMLYTLFQYFSDMRSSHNELPKAARILAGIPGIISAGLLITNMFFHQVFWYDSQKIYHTGPLYNFIYILALLYYVAAAAMLVCCADQYRAGMRRFLRHALVVLLVCTAIQLFNPELLTIDLGIGLCVLMLYLHNSNPTRYVDFMTGAFDKSYFEVWVADQLRKKREIYLGSLRIMNLKEIGVLQGDGNADAALAALAHAARAFDHEHSVFRLSRNCFLIHCHGQLEYEQTMVKITDWLESESCRNALPGCTLCVIGIPKAGSLAREHNIQSYVEYLYRQDFVHTSRIIVSNEEYLSGFRYELEMERYVREAVSKDLFSLAFQPIYHLKKQTYNTVEVLTRLTHPAFGSLNPQKVIEIAEKNSLIDEITRLQLHRLCAVLCSNPILCEKIERFKFNLSPSSFLHSEFIPGLISVIEHYSLPLTKFEFEITESIATESNAEVLQIIHTIQEHGIRLTLDDFGSGYSNLANILHLPFQSVKLDRSLILQVSKRDSAARLYERLVRIMQEYDLEIVCEGVETAQEMQLLTSWGADMVQGYYCSKPLSPEQFLEFLSRN